MHIYIYIYICICMSMDSKKCKEIVLGTASALGPFGISLQNSGLERGSPASKRPWILKKTLSTAVISYGWLSKLWSLFRVLTIIQHLVTKGDLKGDNHPYNLYLESDARP